MKIMPFLFGIGFIAPCITQIMAHFGWPGPSGLSPLVVGLALGGGWGLIANLRGRWL